ncbi:hypothetical protein HK098_004765 [Nowakowskiella sp. JEL0407]|nr:hypothetical protein HK098_004765 [Nowakowskiella sp. JEL0407]
MNDDYIQDDDPDEDVGDEAVLLPANKRSSQREQFDIDDPNMGDSSRSGIWDATFNFTNSIVGAGIIGLPFALLEAGFVTGIILLFLLTFIVDYTVTLLVADGKLAGQKSYQRLVWHCFGNKGLIVISVFQFIFAYGAMCAYAVIVGDTLPSVFSHIIPKTSIFYSILTNRRLMISACTLFVSLPLSLYRDISALAKTSLLSLVAIVYILIAVAIRSPQMGADSVGKPEEKFTVIGPGVFQAIGVISFAFVCHHNTFLIYGSLKTPTMDRMALVTHFSTGLSLLLCLILAITGYLTFTDKTQGNVLNNFPNDDTLINSARALFAVNMFLTFPLECFVCREVIYTYFFQHPEKVDLLNESMDPHASVSTFHHLFVTTALSVSAMLIALLTCDLGFLLELTGGLAATVLAFILPAACYIKLASGPVWSFKKSIAIVLVVFGVLVMVLSTVLTLNSFFRGDSKKKVCNW